MTTTMASGVDTKRITEAQARLSALGHRVFADGRVGPQTKAALSEFQKTAGLPVNGELDDATWERLMARQPPPPTQSHTTPTTTTPTTPAQEPVGRARLHVLADQPEVRVADDRLGFDAYADAIAGIIDNPKTGTPLTIAISAPWGAGKSTLAAMVRERLETKPAAGGSKPHVTCAFNAWMHDDARNLGSAFAAEVARAAHRRRSLVRRLLRPIPWALATTRERTRQLGSVVLLALLLLIVGAWFGGLTRLIAVLGAFDVLTDDQLQALTDLGDSKAFGTFAAAVLAMAGRLLFSIGGSLSSFVKDPEAAATRGTLNRVQEQLGALIRQATPRGSRFVIFVDDLERCRPPRAVDLLEIANQMLGHEGVVTVIMADMPAVAACAEIKYKTLAERYNPADRLNLPPNVKSTYGRLYLQKIVQLQFDIPAHMPERIRELMEKLVVDQPPRAPETPEPWAVRVWRPVRLRAVDFWAGARGVLALPESVKVLALGGIAALPLLVDALGRLPSTALLATHVAPDAALDWLLPLAVGDPTAVWIARAVAVGLAGGAWIAFALARREARRAMPRAVSSGLMAGIAVAVWGLDKVAFDPVRSFVTARDWFWLTSAIAPPGTSWFWTCLAGTLVTGGLVFVFSRTPALPGEVVAEAEADVPRAARAAWWLLAVAQIALVIDRIVLVEGGAVWRIFDGGNADAPAVYALLLEVSRAIGGAVVAGALVWVVAACWSSGRDARLAEARRHMDARLAKGEEPAPDAAFDRKQFTALVNERKLLHVINDSALLKEAYSQVLAHLYQPRSAKRAINRLRLLLFVAHARRAFGGTPALTPSHIGRWVAFQERWPEVAGLMIGNPPLMGELEQAPTPDARRRLLAQLAGPVAKTFAEDEELRTFLAERKITLGPVMHRLIHLPPAG